MNRELEKAKRLLARLRMRTEQRGATAAEAAQAAELAERIAVRYGLDKRQPDKTTGRADVIGEKRWPPFATVLAMAMAKRFDVTAYHWKGAGEDCQVEFEGLEHRVAIAVWLFQAIADDLIVQSQFEARRQGRKGAGLVRFRNRFRTAAAWQVHNRLCPPKPLTPAEKAKAEKRIEKAEQRCAKKAQPMSVEDLLASTAGQKFGSELSIDDNGIGTDHKPLAITHQ